MSNETRKEKIRSMIDSIVDDNHEQTEVDFHGVATDIVRELVGVPTEPEYQEVEGQIEIEDDESGYEED